VAVSSGVEMNSQVAWDNIQLNLLTLSFPKDIESAYSAEKFAKSLRHVRIAMLLAIFFFSVFGLLDAWIVPEVRHQYWFIPLCAVFPIRFSNLYFLLFSLFPEV